MKQGKPSLSGVQPSLLSARAENMSKITSTENADCKSRLVSVRSPLQRVVIKTRGEKANKIGV